ncbi:hypothetical protein D4R52_02320, partial [bacterium]
MLDYLLLLENVSSLPVEQIGQKAKRLGILKNKGYTIPPGIVIPSTEVKKFWKDGQVEIPKDISMYIWENCQNTFRTATVETRTIIVRSTGVEDGEVANYSGQFVSVPNVNTLEEMHAALIQCIESSRAQHVKRYAEASGTEYNHNLPFAVLIMPQRECVCSGVLFSRVKMDGNGQECLLVQVTKGNNFNLTSGTQTGDILYVDRNTGEVICSIPTTRATVEFTNSTLFELTEQAIELERFMGFDADIEWGLNTNGRIEFFQIRPITSGTYTPANLRLKVIVETAALMKRSLKTLESRGVQTGVNYWSDQNIAELITDFPSRMAFGIFTYIFAHGEGAIRTGRNQMGYEIGPELEDGFFELIGDRPRCSIAHDALTYRIKGIPLEDYVNGFISRYLSQIADDPQLANYPEVVLYEQNPTMEFLTQLFGEEKAQIYAECYKRFFSGIRLLETEVAREFTEEFVPRFQSYISERKREVERLLKTANLLSLAELIKEAVNLLEHLRTCSCVMFVKVARLGFFAYARLRRELIQLFGKEEGRHRLDQITAGLTDDASLLFNVRLADLRDDKIELSELLEEYGHLGPNELEIANPRYRDQVQLLERMATAIQGDPRQELKQRAEEALVIGQAALMVCEEQPTYGIVASELKKDIEVARRYLAMRERAKYFYLMEYDLLRRILVHISQILGIEEDLIFELDPREFSISRLVTDPDGAVELMKDRRAERELLRHLPIPQVVSFGNLAEIGVENFDPEAKVLMGIGITPIITTGKAVVILDPEDSEAIAKLEPGCVLVTKTTDPTWAPIIASVGGGGALVTEIGGPLAHGAIVARDLGIACV